MDITACFDVATRASDSVAWCSPYLYDTLEPAAVGIADTLQVEVAAVAAVVHTAGVLEISVAAGGNKKGSHS